MTEMEKSDIILQGRRLRDRIPIDLIKLAGVNLDPKEYDFIYGYPSLSALPEVDTPCEIMDGPFPQEWALYVHIPFCNYSCSFCYFGKTARPNAEDVNTYLSALLSEIESLSVRSRGTKLNSVYLGGGTPTYLCAQDIERVLNKIKASFVFTDDYEWTVESSPESLDIDKIRVMKSVGVNRISLGVQSLNADLLARINRNHSIDDVYRSIELVFKAGMRNFNLDFIYGFPGQSVYDLMDVIEMIDANHLNSVTWYQLWQHMSTPLGKLGWPQEIDEANMLLMKCILKGGMEYLGYSRDKIDWFVKDMRFRQKQQGHKWSGGDFIGVGLSSYGFLRGQYIRNHTIQSRYLESVKRHGTSLNQALMLTADDYVRRRVILGIKTEQGVPREIFDAASSSLSVELMLRTTNFLKYGLLEERNDSIRLSEMGQLLGDDLVNALVLSEDDRRERTKWKSFLKSH